MDLVGIEKLSFREIAKNLDVVSSAPYNHFNSKNELLNELIKIGTRTRKRTGKPSSLDTISEEGDVDSEELSTLALTPKQRDTIVRESLGMGTGISSHMSAGKRKRKTRKRKRRRTKKKRRRKKRKTKKRRKSKRRR